MGVQAHPQHPPVVADPAPPLCQADWKSAAEGWGAVAQPMPPAGQDRLTHSQFL